MSDYIVTLYGLSVTSCAAVKDLAVIVDSSLSFEDHADNITRIVLFQHRNIGKIKNIMSLQDAEKLLHEFIPLDWTIVMPCSLVVAVCAQTSFS